MDADNVVAYGPGVEPEHCRANVPLTFTVDASRSAPAPLAVEVKSDKGEWTRVEIDVLMCVWRWGCGNYL